MAETAHGERLEIAVGGLSRTELMSRLNSRGVLLNAHAETLLEDAVFDQRAIRAIEVTERTVADLGLPDGVTLPQILERAQQRGLLLCPADTGPYLRMALSQQATSLDSVMSSGKAPAGALTVAAETLSADDDYPRGFYLRVVDGQAWLRGYRCDDEHPWSADDRFVFRLAPAA
jgi:hypothetical protein